VLPGDVGSAEGGGGGEPGEGGGGVSCGTDTDGGGTGVGGGGVLGRVTVGVVTGSVGTVIDGSVGTPTAPWLGLAASATRAPAIARAAQPARRRSFFNPTLLQLWRSRFGCGFPWGRCWVRKGEEMRVLRKRGSDWFTPKRAHAPGGFVRRRRRPVVELFVDHVEAKRGVRRSVRWQRQERCDACAGDGGAAGARSMLCPGCAGTGRRRVSTSPADSERSSQVERCSVCGGRGRLVGAPCERCGGAGERTVDEAVEVDVPPGAADGQRIALVDDGAREVVVRVLAAPGDDASFGSGEAGVASDDAAGDSDDATGGSDDAGVLADDAETRDDAERGSRDVRVGSDDAAVRWEDAAVRSEDPEDGSAEGGLDDVAVPFVDAADSDYTGELPDDPVVPDAAVARDSVLSDDWALLFDDAEIRSDDEDVRYDNATVRYIAMLGLVIALIFLWVLLR
jgi:hypothetical protein